MNHNRLMIAAGVMTWLIGNPAPAEEAVRKERAAPPIH